MRPSLELKFGQQLAMTPQLQQAIRLLQLSTLDLQQEIQSALDSNPMLELEEDSDSAEKTSNNEAETASSTENGLDTQATTAEANNESIEAPDQDWNDSIPDDLPVDSVWEDVYQNTTGPVHSDHEAMDIDANNTVTESLQDHLIWQLNLTPMSEVDHLIALTIIDSTGPDGYLNSTIEQILESVNRELGFETLATDSNTDEKDAEEQVEEDEVLAVLRRLQHFDPLGACCRDLSECLAVQLDQMPADTPWRDKAREVVVNHMALLGTRDYAQLMRRMRIKQPELQEILSLIQTLNPKPGEMINQGQAEYVVPDVVVKKNNGRWQVELNGESIPRLRINNTYSSLVKRADNSKDNNFLKEHLQEARWFLKSLQSRNETLLKVASKIVEVQQGFLEYGEEAMKPLVLNDIAQSVGMHESTISRVTTQKYLHTPRGIFELKYFFSSQVSTEAGGACSSTAIRALIKKLVAAETPQKPLSDNKIAVILSDQGINVARRTIAKYRESLSIPPSNERKRLV